MIVWDLRLAILMARLRYRVVPDPLPPSDDVHALAEYWKRWYNTRLGAGKVEDFVDAYDRHVR